jgi:DNA polymerase-3 subunit gamma/tau
VEIDAASNRGIDEIRSLRERANYAPSLARYKVYIVDEVHMLTEAASNALLKTLEEPPPHVIFILATTEPHKVISTLMSRCQRFNFCRLSQEAMVDKLKLICQKEDIHIEPEALRVIARAATGSLRDAENMLQQLITYYGSQISLAQVETTFGASSDSRVKQLAKCILNRDVSVGLHVISSVNGDGIDLRQFNAGLVEYLRNLLLIKSQCEEALDITADELAEMKGLIDKVTLDYLFRAVKLFAGIDFRHDSYSTLPLELALVECALPSITREGQPSMTKSSEMVEAIGSAQKLIEPSQEAQFPVSIDNTEASETDIPPGIDYLRSRWKEFIHSLRGEGSSGNLDAFLRSACEPVALEDDTLVLGFYYPFHKEKIEDPKYQHLIARKIKEVFDRPYKIKCILLDHKREVPSRPEMQNPLVKAALEMGAKIASEEEYG